MKRDMELVIKILKEVEEKDSIEPFNLRMSDEGYDDDLVMYHLILMSEAGLIETFELTTLGGSNVMVKRLTWDGHEFLDAARNDSVMSKAKEIAKQKGAELSSLPLMVVKDLLLATTKSWFGL